MRKNFFIQDQLLGLDSSVPRMEHHRCHIEEPCFSHLNRFKHSHCQDIALPDRVDPALPNFIAHSCNHCSTCDNERISILDTG